MDSGVATTSRFVGALSPRVERAAAATRAFAAELPASRVNPVVAATFCIMAASFPIELPQRSFRWEIPTITTSLFLAATFLQPLTAFRRLHVGIVGLMIFLLVFGGLALYHGFPETMGMAQLYLFLVQALLMAWATYNLLQHDRLARKALWFYVVACVVRTILPSTGLVEPTVIQSASTGIERQTAFGQDPNYSAMLLAAALLLSIGLTHGPRKASFRVRMIALGLAGFFAVSVVGTGSRGGLLALVVGVMTFAVARSRTPIDRLRRYAFVGFAMLGITYTVLNSYAMRKRIETTAEGGAMAGREVLFPNLWSMFKEKPVLGWGPTNNYYEVVLRSGSDLVLRQEQVMKDPHNLFLELLTSTGLLGAIPFVTVMLLCVRAGWRARGGDYGVVPLALMGVFFVANISLNQIAHKPFWFFMAFAMAAETRLRRGNRDAPAATPVPV